MVGVVKIRFRSHGLWKATSHAYAFFTLDLARRETCDRRSRSRACLQLETDSSSCQVQLGGKVLPGRVLGKTSRQHDDNMDAGVQEWV
jgi:hypothetical protein